MRTLTILLIAVLGMAVTSCSNENALSSVSTTVRGVIITGTHQVIPIYVTDAEVNIYHVGDTVPVYKSTTQDTYYISSELIDSTSTLAILERAN